jgi:hypothetical protein
VLSSLHVYIVSGYEGRVILKEEGSFFLCAMIQLYHLGYDKTFSRISQMFSDHFSVFREYSLGAFANLRKTAITFVNCALRLLVRVEYFGPYRTNFREILYLTIFEKSVHLFKFR